MSRAAIINSTIRIVEFGEVIDNNTQKIESILLNPICSGFLINDRGYFITTRHSIFPNSDDNISTIGDYKVFYEGHYYSFKAIDEVIYSRKDIDILIFEMNIKTQTNFIPLSKVDVLSLSNQVIISGFPLVEQELHHKECSVLTTSNDLITLESLGEIRKGCSGSPAYEMINNNIRIIGLMSYTDNNKHNILIINLLQELSSITLNELLGYRFIKQERKYISIPMLPDCKKINTLVKYRKLFLFKPDKILKILHRDIEHTYIDIEQELERNIDSYSDVDKKAKLKNLLKKYKKLFDILSGDVSVHIKLAEDIGNNHTLLASISRVQSTKEKNNGWKRLSNESFILSQEFDIDKLKLKANDLEYRVNSAYNHSLINPAKYWICNNLPKAVKMNRYYSTSKKYTKYYKSLAVFPIFDKNTDDTNTDVQNFKGLLIVDSPDTGAFDKEHVKIIGGYLAHRLNRLLSSVYFESFFSKTCTLKY